MSTITSVFMIIYKDFIPITRTLSHLFKYLVIVFYSAKAPP